MAELIRLRKRRAQKLTSLQDARNFESLVGDLPGLDEVFRMVSLTEFSAVGVLRFVCERARVSWLGCTTFRVGTSCIKFLEYAGRQGLIRDADFLLNKINAERHGRQRQYGDRFAELCELFGWRVCFGQNHAKLLLFDTDQGFFVLETSSNLNELPNHEFFCLQKDEELFRFYRRIFFEELGAPETRADIAEEEAECPICANLSGSSRPAGKNISPKRKSLSVKPRR